MICRRHAVPGTYSITVDLSRRRGQRDGHAIIVSDDGQHDRSSCDPEMIPTDTGLTDCTVMVTDAGGNIPSTWAMADDDDSPNTARYRFPLHGTRH